MFLGLHEVSISNRKIQAKDVVLGAKIEVPSQLGGIYTGKVTAITDGIATIKVPNSNGLPSSFYSLHLEPVELSDDELAKLERIMKRIRISSVYPEKDELLLLRKSRVAGLLYCTNDWEWTTNGLNEMQRIKD